MSRPSADDPSHRGIMAQPLGVVDVLVSGKPTEHRLPGNGSDFTAPLPEGCRRQNLSGGRRDSRSNLMRDPQEPPPGTTPPGSVCGYVPVRNDHAKDGFGWKRSATDARRSTPKKTMPIRGRLAAASEMASQ